MKRLLIVARNTVAIIAKCARMIVMPETLIDRVRRVLEESGLTQTDFAAKIGIDAPKLTKSLNGKRRFSSYELASVAELGGQSVDWLLKGPAKSRVFAHRALESSVAGGDEVGRQKIDLIDERVRGLNFIGRPLPLPALPATNRSRGKVAQGASAAASYLKAIGVPVRDLSTAALIDRIEAVFGINVVIADLPEGCDGLAFANDSVRAIVLATTPNAPYRQRFTLAHELGHIAFSDAADEPIEEELWARKDDTEMRANAFAANFLAPADEIREVIGTRSVQEAFDDLVLDFQISPESMGWRLVNEKLATMDERTALAGSSARVAAMRAGRGAEHAERIEFASQERPPLRLVEAYLAAYADGETTLAPAASLLGWSLARTEASFGDAATTADEFPGLGKGR